MEPAALRLSALLASATLLVAPSFLSTEARALDVPTAAPDFSRGAVLERVAGWADKQVTGVTATPDGRIFVNLPRWTVDVPISVAEVLPNGEMRAFPNEEWNAWRNVKPLSPADHFICVQSVVADKDGNVWVLDPAAPGQMGPVPGGAKLVRFDPKRRAATQTVLFDNTIAPPGSYLNDVRFSPDGGWAYITDSGIQGALVVVNLKTGKSRRVLAGHPSTQIERGVIPHADGRELRRPDGREPQFAADGVTLSPDGQTLYWQALTGRTLYKVPTSALQDEALPWSQLEAQVSSAAVTHVADGLWTDSSGALYVTNPEQNSVERAMAPGQPLETLIQDPRLRWPDTFSQAPDGSLLVTTSHIQDSPWFKPQATTTPSEVWRIRPR
jgi:sugar lactone lactonase YvrE